jgi:hypothetical protein
MSSDEIEKLVAQQEAVLTAMAAIKDQLDAGEWRRKCLWLLVSINATAERLKKRIPGREQSLKEFLEPLECYANLIFKSPKDLKIVYTCFTLIAQILDETEKHETPSFTDLWQQSRPLTDDLDTLERGDPPSLSASEYMMRSLQPELREAEKVAVAERFDQRSRASIEKMFARRKAEAEQSY